MKAVTKEEYVNFRVSKSHEVFEDAKLLAANKRWNSCVNRLYYSSFYLVTALLFKYDISSVTHNGTKIQFNLNFVKKEIISKELGKLYSNLHDWRQESDYADFIEFDEDTVVPLIKKVEVFNKEVEKLIEK